ncbi:3-dehydroquinate dehydratase [Endomicrobiia bacterium]|uniref:type II 3-dehydroquinate dehydratase n=1 Tax=Endomicrobium trichonymphae TaxID=1408204 RepID=UPI0008662435|nr:type II 3-dehydroquinate dehydratase [Candidatus Endomicrobium trichonymphae]GHT09337.1 3-dehydroquinate dehydratase [Endomicrobiia bacterium]BAV58749.1 3-dehydroquinate synthetase [Candidatus Endomicrobium trichonymphae]GHT16391.1 3-dehydroquinate dehydratase [Endomicrobiia bacterium]GHT24013.1 3-dehydroquinate dehydratase [Endomicrobiia bacterium]GMO55122.1 MAG: type II 3-dehydroquinate dehydratase [Candidatus Endomicrobium trichonymphae]
MKKILVLNGPNINMLGIREPAVYGNITLAEIEKSLSSLAKELKVEVEFFQSNHEGKIVDKIQDSINKIFGIIINPAAFTHTSITIRDALSSISVPTIEVHISNIYAREEFRHKSYIAAEAIGQIAGLGIDGYLFALRKMVSLM